MAVMCARPLGSVACRAAVHVPAAVSGAASATARRGAAAGPMLAPRLLGPHMRRRQDAAATRRQRPRTAVPVTAGLALPLAGSLTLSMPLIPASDPWGTWAALLACAAYGLWAERSTQWGKALSGPLVSTLAGLALANCGVLSTDAGAYAIVNKYLLTLAIPLLLYTADVRRVLRGSGGLLIAFAAGSLATLAGAIAAYGLLPMRALGGDAWKVAAALAARHIGGAINYVAVGQALRLSPSTFAAGLAADSVICALYFTGIFWLARDIPPEPPGGGADGIDAGSVEAGARTRVPNVLDACVALSVGAAICAVGAGLARAAGAADFLLPIVTLLTVGLATLAPGRMAPLAPAGEPLAGIFMQVFFAVVGASGSIMGVMRTSPALFAHSFVAIALHVALALAAGKLLRLPLRDVLLASNANVGGPGTAVGMATSKGWRSLMVPAVLCGTFGYVIATFLGIGLGTYVLKGM